MRNPHKDCDIDVRHPQLELQLSLCVRVRVDPCHSHERLRALTAIGLGFAALGLATRRRSEPRLPQDPGWPQDRLGAHALVFSDDSHTILIIASAYPLHRVYKTLCFHIEYRNNRSFFLS